MHSSTRLRSVPTALATSLLLGACGGGGDGPSGNAGSIATTFSPTSLTITQGLGGSSTLNIVRAGGFAGEVTLTFTGGGPAGLTGSWSPATVPANETSSVFEFTTLPTTNPGTYSLNMRARGQGVVDQRPGLQVIIRPAMAVEVAPNTLTIARGGNATITVTLTRNPGFEGAVELSLESAPAGVTGNFTPQVIPPESTSATVVINVGANATPNTYTFIIRAHSGDVTDQAGTIQLTIT